MTLVLARLGGVARRYGSVVALDGAELELRAGEVHGVLGANGAGKSTLLGVLGGVIRPDAGTLEVAGAPVALTGPRDAWRRGIGLVHQHFTLIPTLSVLENLALGRRGGSASTLRSDVERVMRRTGLSVPLEPPVESLGVGDRQRIEILKVLLREPRVLVLDEPTAVLTPGEIEGLFILLRELADEGRAVALVGHKLDEVLGIADRITVLRAGRTVLNGTVGDCSVGEIVRAMVGSAPADPIAVGLDPGATSESGAEPAETDEGTPAATSAPATLRLDGVRVRAGRTSALEGVDLSVSAGEVVGVAGVEGNGQRELALLLSGRLEPTDGAVHLPEGIGFIPQDRTTEGTIAEFDLTENVALALHRRPEFHSGVQLRWKELRLAAERVRRRYEIAAPSVAVRVGTLSGGNQQRIVVGREIEMASTLLVAENPTRGLDIRAAAFVHDELRRLAAAGVAIVLVSTDLDEVLALSDRIYAICRGRLTEVPGSSRTREGVGALMLGGGGDD